MPSASCCRRLPRPRSRLNFLAHLHLGDGADEAFLAGSLAGDFVKGRLDGDIPHGLAEGIRLHRHIDSFTDGHPLTLRSRRRFSPERRRVAGIIVDVAYDHFLARHWSRFSPEPLTAFTHRAYAVLRRQQPDLPPRLCRLLPYMAEDDWLAGYAQLPRVRRTLDRIARRLSRPAALSGAGIEIRAHYAGLERDFLAFYPRLRQFTRDWRAARRAIET